MNEHNPILGPRPFTLCNTLIYDILLPQGDPYPCKGLCTQHPNLTYTQFFSLFTVIEILFYAVYTRYCNIIKVVYILPIVGEVWMIAILAFYSMLTYIFLPINFL